MGGGTTSNEQPKIATINLQTSSYGLVLPVVYGTNRLSGNLIWYGNFTAIPHTETKSSGGKGGVKSRNTTYTYTAAVMMALCEGPIAGIGSVWKGKDKTSLSDLGLSLFTGAKGQNVWPYLTGYTADQNRIDKDNKLGFSGNGGTFLGANLL